MHFRITHYSVIALLLLISTFAYARGGSESASENSAAEHSEYRIAVFVPGVVAGSPTYEMLVRGVERAAAESDAMTVKVVEGGFNQGEWIDGVTALAAAKAYDLIVSSNPALPEICAAVGEQFPEQKFLILDGYLEGNPNIYTFLYNQMEQAYLIGHMGGLATISDLPGANDDLKVGLIAGQEYPIMNQVIRVGFEVGLTAVDPAIELDFRVIGNWYDASKGAELASSMFDRGVDVILAIAGGANQGIVAEAKKRGHYVLWFDSNGYAIAPGTVIGSAALRQERAAYEKTKLAAEGKLDFGSPEVRGVRDGYVEFIEDDSIYIKNLPEEIRAAQSQAIEALQTGSLELVMPLL